MGSLKLNVKSGILNWGCTVNETSAISAFCNHNGVKKT